MICEGSYSFGSRIGAADFLETLFWQLEVYWVSGVVGWHRFLRPFVKFPGESSTLHLKMDVCEATRNSEF